MLADEADLAGLRDQVWSRLGVRGGDYSGQAIMSASFFGTAHGVYLLLFASTAQFFSLVLLALRLLRFAPNAVVRLRAAGGRRLRKRA